MSLLRQLEDSDSQGDHVSSPFEKAKRVMEKKEYQYLLAVVFDPASAPALIDTASLGAWLQSLPGRTLDDFSNIAAAAYLTQFVNWSMYGPEIGRNYREGEPTMI